MVRSGGPLALLALAALAAPALSAQTPTDLADVCKALGNAKVGQWASFEGTSASGGGTLRLAVVASERASDSPLYRPGGCLQGARQREGGSVGVVRRDERFRWRQAAPRGGRLRARVGLHALLVRRDRK